MFEHLSNPEYVHVLLNPLPVYGLAMGVLGLVIALISGSRAARVTALALIFLSALSAWPVYEYGEKGYDRVFAMADSDGGKWLNEHMARAEKLIYLFYAAAALAALGMAAEFKFPRAAVPIALVTVLLSAGTLGAGGYIAYAGGKVRHREFRYEPPPERPAGEHEHEH
ncbi:MAG: hypothetical protein ABIR71_06280 [Chthoniobacterales bacterium]